MSASPSATRRGFLVQASAGLAAGSLLPASAQTAGGSAPPAAPADLPDRLPYDEQFRRRAFEVRSALARAAAEQPVPPHPTNGDEARYANRIGSDSRGLPHNARGEVDPQAWRLATAAFASRDPADFEKIPLGGTRKLLNPVGTLAVSLDGLNASQFALPPAPALASAQRASEAIEIYWAALLRDVPFNEFHDGTQHRDVLAAAAELSRAPDFQGPKVGGRVTPQTLLRGAVLYVDERDASGRTGRWATPPGVTDGPYVSQFLLRDVPLGSQALSARIRSYTPANEFLTQYDDWLAIQNGQSPKARIAYDNQRRYISSTRDLAAYVHSAAAFGVIANQLLSTAASAADPSFGGIFPASQNTLAPGNPYLRSKTQGGASGTFGAAYFQSLISLASSLGIRVNYYQKWYEQRILRPEAFGGLVQHRLAGGVADYPIHEAFLGSQALERSRARNGSFLLPQVYPEGAPIHSSYPGGAAIIGAVTVTLLKAFYDESLVIPNPVQPDPADPTRLVPYAGPPLTLGGELNKLALNYGSGRTAAGIHWRSDAAASYAQGENLVISLLREQKATFREPFEGFAFTRFDGTRVVI
ncbi:twin-arginine translocation pathway signal protein [Aquincola tertiaricarbonis]|uniref:twin-arginine translocation pathway signal protein n=1 Tax=Aquincola tertiaricarbonis TaxID=391953 RepID=UPI0006154113|nr:twin-arginine translocation pathway signal protein [Aquincola tertiaricarbonis]